MRLLPLVYEGKLGAYGGIRTHTLIQSQCISSAKVGIRRQNHLSKMEHRVGIEPTNYSFAGFSLTDCVSVLGASRGIRTRHSQSF